MRTNRSTLMLSILAAATAFAGCQSAESTGGAADRSAPTIETPADATLVVAGLSCPLCATNIDQELAEIPGVEGVRVDLGEGLVHLDLAPGYQPSEQELAAAVDRAGFTLTRIDRP